MASDPVTLGWSLGVPAGLAFAAGDAVPAEVTVWRLDVRGPASALEALLDARVRAVEVVAARQQEASLRLAAYVAQPSGLAFGAGAGAGGPEAELAGLLAAPPEDAGLAFDLFGGLGERWGSVVERFQAVVDRIGRFLRGLAVVETAIDGSLVARTLVGLDSDMRSVWRRGVARPAMELHARSLEAALAARRQVARGLRLLFEAAALVATLPALASNPAGLLIALPAIWRFIERVTSDPEPA